MSNYIEYLLSNCFENYIDKICDIHSWYPKFRNVIKEGTEVNTVNTIKFKTIDHIMELNFYLPFPFYRF